MKTSALSIRGISYSAMFAALFVVLSFIKIPLGFTPVPITLEGFALMVTGAVLGARYGFFSIATVVVLTALGVPLLHGNGGMSLILGATGGFIWMFPFAALLIGLVVPRIKGTGIVQFVLIFIVLELFGSFLLYVTGVPWLAHVAHFSFAKAMALGCYPYLAGDAVKSVAAAGIIVALRRVNPQSLTLQA